MLSVMFSSTVEDVQTYVEEGSFHLFGGYNSARAVTSINKLAIGSFREAVGASYLKLAICIDMIHEGIEIKYV